MTRGMIAGLCAVVLWPLAAAEEAPRWLTDYSQAREVARAAGKPIFLVFRCER